MSIRGRDVRGLTSTITASTLFQSNLIYHVAKSQHSNDFVVSPIAMRSVLTILSMATIKDMHRELLAAMGLKSSNQGIQEYKGCRNASKDDFIFTVHNAFYLNIRLDLSMQFQTICLDQFQTRIQNIDFQNREEAAHRVNSWIAEQTAEQIGTRVTAHTLEETQDSLIVNIARFESRWRKSFPKKLLTKQDFWITSKQKVPVTMMHDFCEIPMGKLADLKATAVLIPYKNISIYMFILLPNEIDGLAKLEEDLLAHGVDITSLALTLKTQCIKLGLPRFKLEHDMEMMPVLKDLGIKAIFNESMDFARLLGSIGLMKIAQIKHIAAIEINDDGTTQASTKVSFLLTGSEDCISVDIDRPFFFAIMDQERIYYGGHIKNTDNFLD